MIAATVVVVGLAGFGTVGVNVAVKFARVSNALNPAAAPSPPPPAPPPPTGHPVD